MLVKRAQQPKHQAQAAGRSTTVCQAGLCHPSTPHCTSNTKMLSDVQIPFSTLSLQYLECNTAPPSAKRSHHVIHHTKVTDAQRLTAQVSGDTMYTSSSVDSVRQAWLSVRGMNKDSTHAPGYRLTKHSVCRRWANFKKAQQPGINLVCMHTHPS